MDTQPTPLNLRPLAQLTEHPEAPRLPRMDDKTFPAFLADIADRGILTPIEITAAGVILDGRERLRAAHELGTDNVPVRVISPADEITHMYKAALARKNLTPSERAAIAIELDEYQQATATATTRQRQNLKNQSGEVATLPPRGERSRDIAARLAGISPRIVQDASTVKKLDPALFEQVKRGEIPAHQAARRARRQQIRNQAAPPLPLPDGLFDLFYVDPPWAMASTEMANGPEDHYPTMTLDEIKALQLSAAESAVLFLWRVNSLAREAFEVLDAWGFQYRAEIVWIKPSIGPGTWVRQQHETLLMATRGAHPTPKPDLRVASVMEAKRRRHSQKPPEIYDLLERMYPNARRLELFARGKPRPGWTSWGNEADQ